MVESVPDAWTGQLEEGGRLVAVVMDREGLGRGSVFTKSGNTVAARDAFDACPPKFTQFDLKQSFVF
jgi:protein-L-isoaspartate(D-aspartate) O-methyltransferase